MIDDPNEAKDTQEASFAELFEASLKDAPPARLEVGDEVKGRVLQVGEEYTFLDIGGKGEALIATSELLDKEGEPFVSVGNIVEGRIVRRSQEGLIVSRVLQGGAAGKRLLEEAKETGLPVEGLVKAVIKGGLEVEVAGARAFCPASQISLHFVEDLGEFVDQRLTFRVAEYRDGGRSVVLSRKALLAEEREQLAKETRKTLEVGARYQGTVTNVREFGAFVDIGGVEGLVHVSEISHARVDVVSDVLKVGQSVDVEVIKLDGDRISLSMKTLQGDPWQVAQERFAEGTRHRGVIRRLQPYGAFVELAPGMDGLLHVSTLNDPRIRDARAAFEEGQELEVQVVNLDLARQRIGLAPADRPVVEAGGEGAGGAPGRSLRPGDTVTGQVERVEHYGVFLTLPVRGAGGRPLRGLIPREEIPGARDDLRKAYPIGQDVQVQVIEPDDKGRMRLSIKALATAAERAQVKDYLKKEGRGSGGSGLGTLGDLLKKKL